MTGYHNDQFFRLGQNDGEEGVTFSRSINRGAGQSLIGAANPAFVYPDRTIRTEKEGRGAESRGVTTVLKRGYIRSMDTYVGGGVSVGGTKCQFQFNPSTLTQAVESAQSTLNFLQMDPGQYAVPRATSVNFTFDLLFDRSMELNNQYGGDVDTVNPWLHGDPSQVGVLRDLAAFYSVIGQGIGDNQMEYMQRTLTEQINAESVGIDSETIVEDTNKAISNLPAFLQANAANSAFLLPNPVRVMFSSLYMVEGFVTNTTVAFTKFSTSMVPMQCALSVTMEAKYIGFAHKSTFLQWSLEQRADVKRQAEQEETDRLSAIYSTFSKTVNKVNIWLSHAPGTGETAFDESEMSELLGQPGKQFKVAVKIPSASGSDDPVGQLFEAESGMTVAVQADFAVYGPFTAVTGDPKSFVQRNGPRHTLIAAGTLMGSNSKYGQVASAGDWGNLVSGTRTDYFHGASKYESDMVDFLNTQGDFLFVVQYAATVTATIGNTTIKGEGERWEIKEGPLFIPNSTVNLSWPEYSPVEEQSGTHSGSVPPDNAATGTPNPGSSSSVGRMRT